MLQLLQIHLSVRSSYSRSNFTFLFLHKVIFMSFFQLFNGSFQHIVSVCDLAELRRRLEYFFERVCN